MYAAVITPRGSDGHIDEVSFRHQLEFLLANGIGGFALNGATGEFCLTTTEDLRVLLRLAAEATNGCGKFLCGIGSPRAQHAIQFGKMAIDAGAEALLLPMPYFFRYTQDDLATFCRLVSKEVSAPILLYNLPQFASGLESSTVCDLIRGGENIVGIKDSGDSLDILRTITHLGIPCRRIVGNDREVAPALRQGLCDGAVSGVACVFPELIRSLFELQTGSPEFGRAAALLDEFTVRLERFPVPWGLKWISETRDIVPATFEQPVSEHRAKEGEQLRKWFHSWQKTAARCLH